MFQKMLNLSKLNHKGLTMAEKLKKIENDLHKYEFGLENGLITQSEYDELTHLLSFELKQLANQL